VPLTRITDATFDVLRRAGGAASDLATPTVRLGVTGLARAGKTVFITALVRNLLEGGRLPFFAPLSEGRISRAYLEPQPDDAVPRFDYEAHLAALGSDPPNWPESTRHVSQLRVTIEYTSSARLWRTIGTGRLHVDIVDYPGEWLLDLPLLSQSYEHFARDSLAAARSSQRSELARDWLAVVAASDPAAPADETKAIETARAFTAYLHKVRSRNPALTSLGPGRFLLPGELAGSPLVTFAPLDMPSGWAPSRGSLAHMMQRRFDSYKEQAIKPFFRAHFSRLDRQIVLVDALAALDQGPDGVEDLTTALTQCLSAFRPGASSWLAPLLGRRIDRIVFAASKADLLPQTSHDRLDTILRHITDRAMARAATAGADVKTLALAALRATREAERRSGTAMLACIVGTPTAGQRIGNEVFDGTREVAIFPGDLPADIAAAARGDVKLDPLHVIRFQPPRGLETNPASSILSPWPHVRLDRALEFLLGDRLA
jgi:hypothetical protein